MPSAADFQTAATASALVSKYVVLVQEHLGLLQPAPAAGTRQQLAAATYQLHFTVWVANSQSSGDRGLKQTAAMLPPSVTIKRGRSR